MKHLVGFLETFHRNKDQGLTEAWSELARRTNLTYEPPDQSLLNRFSDFNTPKVYGMYRGHYLSLVRAAFRFNDYDPIIKYNEIWLELQNSAQYTLDIHRIVILDGLFGGNKISSGNEDFDQRFKIKGQPQEFVRTAAKLIGRTEPRLLTWMIQYHPYFKLERSFLVCRHGMPRDLQIQIDFLNLLCDLADIVEKRCG